TGITTNSDIDIMILTLISRKDMCGYEILKEIEIKFRGSFTLKEGGVYPILHGLEGEGLLTSYWIEDEINKKYYRLTDIGREYMSKKEESTDYNKSTRRALNLEGMGWK
ncbi:PadR family transcriptional regulator, partial [Clostridium paraputrificum]|uniref:PadR family transcriptional regulator n=1 Tax=Clostridium paraputrificum TaxID=29363 RepID=UPI0034A2B557